LSMWRRRKKRGGKKSEERAGLVFTKVGVFVPDSKTEAENLPSNG